MLFQCLEQRLRIGDDLAARQKSTRHCVHRGVSRVTENHQVDRVIAIFCRVAASSNRSMELTRLGLEPRGPFMPSRGPALVAHSWFHARRRAAPKRAERVVRRGRLGSEIREIFEQSKRCYGAPRIHAELEARGFRTSKRTVAKLMGLKRFAMPSPGRSRHCQRSFAAR